jgi:hypothetical protein
LAAKQQGTERSLVRPPYFSRFEIQAGMAYANEAAQRGQLAQMQRQLAGEANAPVAASSEALSTAPDDNAAASDEAQSDATSQKSPKTRRTSTRRNGEKSNAAADPVKQP